MSDSLEIVRFQDDAIIAKRVGDHVYIAIGPFCRTFGLKESIQRNAITGDPVLSQYTHMGTLGRGGRPAVFLRLDKLNGWLFRINSRKVAPTVKLKVIAYQEKCYDVLSAHFTGKRSQRARVKLPANPNRFFERYDDPHKLPGAYGHVPIAVETALGFRR